MNSLYTRTIFLCVLFTLFLAPNIFAQQIIKGQLIDEVTSEPLVGVHILPVGEGNGSISDVSGSFTITIAAGVDSLDISYIGYETQRVRAVADLGIVQLKQSTVLLNQLVVSGNREEKERTDIPAALTTVSSQTLEETKAVTLDQVLNKVTGVYMPDLGNEQHMMSIRQPISTKSLFLYLEDGIPIRTMGVFNHNSLIEMNMAALKQVEVIRGPYSSIYGSEAIGGAINFITARPSAVPTVKLSVRGSSLGYKRVDFQASNTLG
ncbi:MAG: TonB-dependent receptor plug domain-containing protein, partial [Cyclobacteriaceae bacterium]|nr:TonB-dependent receptor plug domain-containing protein [Cyclobacteriaceae bacterium]